MALREILQEGDNTLRSKSREVTAFDKRLWALLDDMRETMNKADGVGLASPQVGILKRVAIVCHDDVFLELVNPKIISCEGEAVASEGCLSVDSGKNCEVKRPKKITVEAFDRYGNKFTAEQSDWVARIICHEVDHLDGVLFIDKKVE